MFVANAIRSAAISAAAILASVPLGSCCLATPIPAVGCYEVMVESGIRRTTSGDRVQYTLFIPQFDSLLPPPPWPAVVLAHGFARDRTRHRGNAMYLAERGVVVMTPDMSSLLGGASAQLRNISNLVDHVQWLAERSVTPGDALDGLLDATRIGLAGHSAGGSVSFEAAIDTQDTATPAAAVCLLDAVPWERTTARAAEFPAIAFASWRSEPQSCNAHGKIRALLNQLTFPTEDVRIVGGTHCDPENPSDGLCAIACGRSTPDRQLLYQELLHLFIRDALDAPLLSGEPLTYVEALDEFAASGSIVATAAGDSAGFIE